MQNIYNRLTKGALSVLHYKTSEEQQLIKIYISQCSDVTTVSNKTVTGFVVLPFLRSQHSLESSFLILLAVSLAIKQA